MFVTSLSIVVSAILSTIFFDFVPTPTFGLGATIVVVSTAVYQAPPATLAMVRETASPTMAAMLLVLGMVVALAVQPGLLSGVFGESPVGIGGGKE